MPKTIKVITRKEPKENLYVASLTVGTSEVQLESHPNVEGLTITNQTDGSIVDVGISGTLISKLDYLAQFTFNFPIVNSNVVYVISDTESTNVGIMGGY